MKRRHTEDESMSMDSDSGRKGRPPKVKKNTSSFSQTFEPGTIEHVFDGFRSVLDAQHDKYERLVKLSRDLTICSKRAIFTLQRSTLSSKESCATNMGNADKLLDNTAGDLLRSLAEELRDTEPRRYCRAYSPGIQEYVEARALRHFVAFGTLPRLDEIEKYLKFDDDQLILGLWPVDYLLGVADLGGELMRLAINSAASGDREAPFLLRDFVRELQCRFAVLDWAAVPGRGIGSKYRVLRTTMLKMETACYSISLRGTEISGRMMQDLFNEQPGDGDSTMTVA